jgi:N-acetylglutamate synthase-like GNAT family acetyltransferase
MNFEITTNYETGELSLFKALALDQWPDVVFPCEGEPKPILAKHEGSILGGLSYINYPHPSRDESALWINSLLVTPDWQDNGVGSELVQAAMQAIAPGSELFVYTDVPNLYRRLGWLLVSDDNKSQVLSYVHKHT